MVAICNFHSFLDQCGFSLFFNDRSDNQIKHKYFKFRYTVLLKIIYINYFDMEKLLIKECCLVKIIVNKLKRLTLNYINAFQF